MLSVYGRNVASAIEFNTNDGLQAMASTDSESIHFLQVSIWFFEQVMVSLIRLISPGQKAKGHFENSSALK